MLLASVRNEIDLRAGCPLEDLRASAVTLGAGDVAVACAVASLACQHVLGVKLHEQQLLASALLCGGTTVQMRTGEGKTFAAVAPALLFAKTYGAVHVVTANPYLAERDAEWSGSVLRALGLQVAATLPGRPRATTRDAYRADVVYGAAADFGFDYLRDRLVLPGDDPVQRGRPAAIIDEIDAVLIDGALTPLVLSAPSPTDVDAVRRADRVIAELVASGDRDHFNVDELLGRAELTDSGIDAVEALLNVGNLFQSTAREDWPFLIHSALRAHLLLRRDRDYVVQDGADAIGVVDDLTGRILPGRRWSDGLHQAVEAKERVAVTTDRRTLGTVTTGSYFGGYEQLVGMSGTLEGAEHELRHVYNIESLAVPTHRRVRRVDHPDVEVADESTKFERIADDTATRHHRDQPVLVGTVSIDQANRMSVLLTARRVPHRVLTARNDAAEAEIISQAGKPGAVTVATQMAGRGVDIIVDHRDGLMVWGVEHHASLRLDLQLRGRAGRQGHPGETQFGIAQDDQLLEFGGDVAIAQQRVEDLDAATRRESRTLDVPIDSLHDLVHDWRLKAADDDQCRTMLADAVRRIAASHLVGLADRHGITNGLPHTTRRRDRELHRRIGAALGARHATLEPGAWDAVTSAVLRALLLAQWTDTLDQLDSDKHLARISQVFGLQPQMWAERVEGRYATFRTQVQRAWILHLLSGQIVRSDTEAEPTDAPLDSTANVSVLDVSEVEIGYDHEWTGPSFNKFIRRHLSVTHPDPPLVLELDAIGDATPNTVRVVLDHDDPSQTRIVLPPS